MRLIAGVNRTICYAAMGHHTSAQAQVGLYLTDAIQMDS